MKYLLIVIVVITIFTTEGKAKVAYKHTMQDSQDCKKCHDMAKNKKYIHMPVRVNSCSSCHNVFVKTKKLLRMTDIVKKCVMCHPKKRTLIEKGKNIHPPVKRDCTNCHDPHAGNRKFRLKADKRKNLCLMCHTKKKKWLKNATAKHGAIYRKNGGCIACHDPHSTGRKKMLKKSVNKLCLSCHNKTLKRDEDGVKLLNIAKHLRDNKKWHKPIKSGNCVSCHNPHGSKNHRMLHEPFPTKSVVKFDPKKYICFKCHESTKITEKSTTTDTNFRRDKKNLHTIHVQKFSIACGTCHDFHASKKGVPLIKEKTTYSGTEFKLRYIKTPNGGSCNPICHNKREYNNRFQPK